jgi:hypothetical protein
MPTKRIPKSYYFSRLYSKPFHRNVDRIAQVDFRTFDPFVPENRQTVANCKKHRRQRHELSDKCKHVLAIVDAQENLLAVKPLVPGQQITGNGEEKTTEISIEFGDGIPEIAKEYIKFWLTSSGLVNKPYSRQYDVHNIKDEHNHSESPSIVMMVPFEDLPKIQEKGKEEIFGAFNKNPREFARKFKIGNVRIYSTNKVTGEEDALGLKDYLPLKIVGSELIGKDLKKATVYRGDDPLKYSGYENDLKHIDLKQRTIEQLEQELFDLPEDTKNYNKQKLNIENRIANERDRLKKLVQGVEGGLSNQDKKELLDSIDAQGDVLHEEISVYEKKKQNKENRDKELEILSQLLSPEANIAENRGKSGTDPIGRALQVAETAIKAPMNVLNVITQRKEQKEKEKNDELQNQLRDLQRQRQKIDRNPSESYKVVFEVKRDKQEKEAPTQTVQEEAVGPKTTPQTEEELKNYEKVHEQSVSEEQEQQIIPDMVEEQEDTETKTAPPVKNKVQPIKSDIEYQNTNDEYL